MSITTRFPNGLTNVEKNTSLGDYGAPDPTKFHTYFNDFNTFTAADWTITTVETGASSPTQSIVNSDGGILFVLNDDAASDSTFLQLTGETFKFESGKKLFFKTKMRMNLATSLSLICGLQIKDTTPLDVTDGVFFQSPTGNNDLNLRVEKDDTATTSSTIAMMANNTDVEVGFMYDGVDKICYSVNNIPVSSVVTTNLPDDEDLTVSFGIENGNPGAGSMSIDYIFVSKER